MRREKKMINKKGLDTKKWQVEFFFSSIITFFFLSMLLVKQYTEANIHGYDFSNATGLTVNISCNL